MSGTLRIVCDHTSSNYPWVVMDEKNRWIKVCRTSREAKQFIEATNSNDSTATDAARNI